MRTNGNNQAGDVMRASENIQNIHLKECKNILKQVKMCVVTFLHLTVFFYFCLFVCSLVTLFAVICCTRVFAAFACWTLVHVGPE